MFIDASAVVAILGREQGFDLLAYKIEQAVRVYVSPIVVWEATLGLVRSHALPFEQAQLIVEAFVDEIEANTVAIDGKIGRLALDASRLYGKGRHVASLNFGDCFSYACAKAYRLPLLYIGEYFAKTDMAY
jgi:ribonuclease VapC